MEAIKSFPDSYARHTDSQWAEVYDKVSQNTWDKVKSTVENTDWEGSEEQIKD